MKYKLPKITMYESSKGHYHAICYQAHEWYDALWIIKDTPHVDPVWVTMCERRGYFTLRIVHVGRQVMQTKPFGKEDCTPNDFASFSLYHRGKR